MNELDNFLSTTEFKTGTKNIADFKEIILEDVKDIKQETVGEGEKAFTQYVAMYRGEKIKIPVRVFIDLQAYKKEGIVCSVIRVLKSGEGLKTSYQLLPIDTHKD